MEFLHLIGLGLWLRLWLPSSARPFFTFRNGRSAASSRDMSWPITFRSTAQLSSAD